MSPSQTVEKPSISTARKITFGIVVVTAIAAAVGAAYWAGGRAPKSDLIVEAGTTQTLEPARPSLPPPLPGGEEQRTGAIDTVPAPSAMKAPTEIADMSLIHRLLPNSLIRNPERLDMGQGTWIWEIDMLADKDDPSSGGFVYLSADGTKLLNGPLMDKRSRIGMSAPVRAPSSAHTNAPVATIHGARPSSAEVEPKTGEDAMKDQAIKASKQRDMFMSGIEQLPYISTTKGGNPVYVMFDPLCSACAKLYKQHQAVSDAYNVEFRWIPIFNNEKSYPLSALLRKTYDQDHGKGVEMLKAMLSKTWKTDDHIQEISQLTDGDYGLIKPAAQVYMSINEVMPGVGTPYVMFRNASGNAEAFSGVPLSTDWISLKPWTPVMENGEE